MKKSGSGQILLLGIAAVILLALVSWLMDLFPDGSGDGPGPGPGPEPPQPPIVAPEPSTGPTEITIDGRAYQVNGEQKTADEIVEEVTSRGEERVIIIRKDNSRPKAETKLQDKLESKEIEFNVIDEKDKQ